MGCEETTKTMIHYHPYLCLFFFETRPSPISITENGNTKYHRQSSRNGREGRGVGVGNKRTPHSDTPGLIQT